MIRSRRLVPALLVPAAMLLAVYAPAAAVAAAPAAPAAPAQSGAYLRLAHLSPDTPQVDVYVASVSDASRSFIAKGVGYGVMSDYQIVQADSYTVSMRAAGAPADSPPVLTTTLAAKTGSAYTVAGLGKYAELALRVLEDDLSMPPDGQARVRVIQASITAPSIEVSVKGGDSVFSNLAFAQTTGYRTVPAGSWTLMAGPSGGQTSELPVTLAASGVYTVLLVDKDGKLTADLHADALGAGAVVPVGGTETGMGGTATPPSSAPIAAVLLVLAAAGSAGLVATVRRRFRQPLPSGPRGAFPGSSPGGSPAVDR